MAEILSPKEVIEDYRQKFIDALHKSITENKVLSGGGLFQSVTAQVRVYGQMVSLEISMEDYWKFLEQGVNGTSAKVGSEFSFKKKNIKQSAMLQFMKNRGIKAELTAKKTTQIKGLKNKTVRKSVKQVSMETARKNLAFVLGRHIAKYGTKPTHFASEVMEGDLAEQFQRSLTESVGRQIRVEIEKELP